MSFFLNREALSTAGEPATLGAPASFSENYAVNFEAGHKLESMLGLEYEFQERDQKNLEEIKRITGEDVNALSLDLYMRQARRYANEPPDADADRYDMLASTHLADQDKRFAELKQRFPQIKTRREIFDAMREDAQQLHALREDVSRRSGFWGGVGAFAGAAFGAFSERDPLNVATLGVGGFGRTLAVKVLSEAGLNSAIEAVDQFTGVIENKRLLGVPTTPGQVALDITAAGVGAGLIRGGIDVGVPIAKEIGRRALDYTKLSTGELLNRFRAETPVQAQAAPSVRAVDLALEREAEFAERANPMRYDETSQGTQAVIPGAERISDRELAERTMEKPLATDVPQRAPGEDGGLFDLGARQQADIFDAPTRTPIQAAAIHTRALDAAEEALHGYPERFDTVPLPTEREIADHAGRVEEAFAPYLKQAEHIVGHLKDLQQEIVDITTPKKLKKALGYMPVSLSRFIKEHGGIVDADGELSSRGVHARSLPGLVRKGGEATDAKLPGLAGKVSTARQIDYVKEEAFDAGYFPDRTDYNDITDSELYDAIAQDVFGSRIYKLEDNEAIDALLRPSQVLDDLDREGFSYGMSVDDVARALIERDEQLARDLMGPGIADEAEYRAAMGPDALEHAHAAYERHAETAEAQALADFAELKQNIDESDLITIENENGEIVTVTMRQLLDDMEADDAVLQAMKTCGIGKKE